MEGRLQMHHDQDQVCIYHLNRGYFTFIHNNVIRYSVSHPYINMCKRDTGSEIYERLPDSGSQADDLDERVGSDEFIGGRLAGGHESDVYSSLDRTGENGDAGMGTGSTERLVRPSQMKKNKQGK